MATLAFTPRDGGPHPLAAVWDDIVPDQLRWAAAFASETGVRKLTRAVGRAALRRVRSEWLVGIHRGVTTPDALTVLRGLPRGDVRVPFGRETLAAPGLDGRRVFHPKVCCLVNAHTRRAAVVSASGNLTHGGLVANVEQWLTWTGALDDPEALAFEQWWGRRWAVADVADAVFVRAYDAARPRLPAPSRGRLVAAPTASALRAASWLWVELVKPPHGGSFNQLELMLNAHDFFFPGGVRGAVERQLTFEDAGGAVFDAPGRKVRFHGGASGNQMWRVNLPTHYEGLDGYQDGDVLIRFTRTTVRDRYRLEVVPAASSTAASWLRAGKVASPPTRPPRHMGWGP